MPSYANINFSCNYSASSKKNTDEIIGFIKNLDFLNKDSFFLDVGCGNAFLSYCLIQNGYKNCYGIDGCKYGLQNNKIFIEKSHSF